MLSRRHLFGLFAGGAAAPMLPAQAGGLDMNRVREDCIRILRDRPWPTPDRLYNYCASHSVEFGTLTSKPPYLGSLNGR